MDQGDLNYDNEICDGKSGCIDSLHDFLFYFILFFFRNKSALKFQGMLSPQWKIQS